MTHSVETVYQHVDRVSIRFFIEFLKDLPVVFLGLKMGQILCVIMALWVLKGLRYYCSKHAHEEVYAILSDPQRRSEVKGVFDAIQGQGH